MQRIRVRHSARATMPSVSTHSFPTITAAILAGALIQPGDLVHITGTKVA